MKYRVDWITAAEISFERIWTLTADKLGILNTAIKIDSLLADDPYRPEAVVQGNERTLIIEPLAVDYAVFEDAMQVIVLKVWMIGYLTDQE
ncbi:MAG TPA: hypothetical protein VGI40_20690 [Pirellulaceae bacterium]|jgi:hypothetical protein